MSKESKQDISVSTQSEAAKTLYPLTSFFHRFEEMEQRMDKLFGGGWLSRTAPERNLLNMMEPISVGWPSVDLIDRENEVVVRAEIPGVEKKNVNVAITGDMLTIKGEVSQEKKEEKENYYRCEISKGSFARSIYLPVSVDASKVKAELKDGVLEVTLPKLEVSKSQNIKVQ